MYQKHKKVILLLLFLTVARYLLPFIQVGAQDQTMDGSSISFGVAYYLPVNGEGKEVLDGNIISAATNGFTLSKKSQDSLMAGVITRSPAIVFEGGDMKGKYPVVSSGTTRVLVNTSAGNIKKGDLITTSEKQGVGAKATKSGYVLGTSLEDFSSSNINEARRILISINIHYLTGAVEKQKSRPFDMMNVLSNASNEDPLTVFRFISAPMILLLAIILGFMFFGRVASLGVEALGRNPLASRTIQIAIFMNVMVTIAIISAGAIVALFMLTL